MHVDSFVPHMKYRGCNYATVVTVMLHVLSLVKEHAAEHNVTLCFCGITCSLFTSCNWWWISTSVTSLPCKNWITQYISTFDHVSSRPVVLKLIVWWYSMLMVPARGCKMTHTMYTFPLHGEIHRWMVLCHVQHAVTYFVKLPCVFPVWEAYLFALFVIFLA
jgi:hypothetical protein